MNVTLSNSKKTHHQQASQNPSQQQIVLTGDTNHVGADQSEPILAFFGVCIPFGPPALLEMPTKDSVFKSKHRLDMSIISLDSRGRQLLGLSELTIPNRSTPSTTTGSRLSSISPDKKLTNSKGSTGPNGGGQGTSSSGLNQSTSNGLKQANNISAYDLVHHDDLSYMASAHQELLKTGASGLIAYRVVTQPDGKLQWLQTSAKLFYKNSKPDYIICTHRPLMEEEGRDLLGKRTMDFKVTFLDLGFSSINDRIMACDKFSTFQSLTCASKSSAESPSLTANGASSNHRQARSASSPALSGESSRSLASLSPQSSPNNQGKYKSGIKRKYNYDTNTYHTADFAGNQVNFVSAQPYTGAFESPYKQGHTGEIYYDMDAMTNEVDPTMARKYTNNLAHNIKKKTAKQSACKGGTTNKRDQYSSSDVANPMEQMMLLGTDTFSAKSVNKKSYLQKDLQNDSSFLSQHHNLHQQQSHHYQQSQYPQQACNVEPQLHLYSHYGQSHDADSYPATQAVAAYAAAATHQNHTYGSAINHHLLSYGNHQNSAATQSLYGSSVANMMSPTSSAAYTHQQQHQQFHHNLESSAAGHHYASVGHYGSLSTSSVHQQAHQITSANASSSYAGSATASSFLPTEHLLHHYTQSAARNAALAAWQPQSGSTSAPNSASQLSDYQSGGLTAHSIVHSHAHQSIAPTPNDYATGSTAAVVALVASSATNGNDPVKRETDTSSSYSPSRASASRSDSGYTNSDQQQQQHYSQSPSSTITDTRASPKSASKSLTSAIVAHRLHQATQKGNATPSLSSDGSIHRSPLSSGESSNSSAGVTAAAHAMAIVSNNTSGRDLSMLSPTTYYGLPNEQHTHGAQDIQASHNHQALGSYQNPYAAAVAHQYASDSRNFNYHQHHHHGQLNQQSSTCSTDHHNSGGYFQHTSNDLSIGQTAAVATQAVKLYGSSNGKLKTVAM